MAVVDREGVWVRDMHGAAMRFGLEGAPGHLEGVVLGAGCWRVCRGPCAHLGSCRG